MSLMGQTRPSNSASGPTFVCCCPLATIRRLSSFVREVQIATFLLDSTHNRRQPHRRF
jgi:hypothetical protein